MDKDFSAFVIVAVGTGINLAYAAMKSHEAMPILIGGITFGTACVALNSVTNENLGTMLAVLFLVGTFLRNGVPVMEAINTAVSSS